MAKKRFVKKKRVKAFGFKCITFEQAGHSLVLFTCSAKRLWRLVQINQRSEDSEKGYQRAVSPSRAARIADFIDRGNVIPNTVLVSFDHAKIVEDKIVIDNRHDAGWVIDGQHRLAGGNESDKDIILPVVAFTDLDLKNQIKCFVTINKEQKGVPSSLYLELLSQLPGSRNETEIAKERCVDLAHMLKQDEESPFYNRIVSTVAPKQGELSLTNFVRKVHPLLRKNAGRLTIYNDEERAGILSNYYRALQNVFPAEFRSADSIFFKTLGFGALISALPAFLDLAHGKFQVSHVAKLWKRLDYIDFSQWNQRGSGSAAENLAAEDLRTELLASTTAKAGDTKIQL
jgi:DGQHR domain-containing protein